ncbi:NAD-dependent DNA ligase LigA [Helicobacter sp. 11S02629-2]|uniref:NAD-dependent DNA ligase LigA n=1 Tax=Helicobacter sp. 11S02629-2 TaxID=1476195 RepID=UPI000BA55EDB|nr:NAD-dependent DNA ligase LigA [Helicobacter sp. 11S02629-2]PAF45407.1 DNA ligase (NAD(+)) LigA [Helicobacter sp. 11S02629-2]
MPNTQTNKIKTIKDYKDALDLLNTYARAYYTGDTPLISDDSYDLLYRKVKAFEASNPTLIDPLSPTQRVGDKLLNDFKKSKHIYRMWSLDDIFNKQEFATWLKTLLKNISDLNYDLENYSFCVSPKFDGLSLNLLYKEGRLVSAATRGDGEVGEVVLEQAKLVEGVPLNIAFTKTIEIRGEVVISKTNFESYNAKEASLNQKTYANPRNLANATLRQLDLKVVAERKLEFIPWGIGYVESSSTSLYELMKEVLSLGFKDNFMRYFELPKHKLESNLLGFQNSQEEKKRLLKSDYESLHTPLEDAYLDIQKQRESFACELDGAVIVLNDRILQERLGFSVKVPRFACAYKFKATYVETKLLDVTWQLGRSGVLTPVAILAPIMLQGALISRATLHNIDEIKRLDLKLNDTVLLTRSGDVIPKIESVVITKRGHDISPISLPTNCPVCGEKVSFVQDPKSGNTRIICTNKACIGILKARLSFYTTKDCMDIENLASSTISALVDAKLVNSIKDLYFLRPEDLLKLEGFKDKKALKIIDSIKASIGTRELWRFINALGIAFVGKESSKVLESTLGLKCFEASLEVLETLPDLSSDTCTSFSEYCKEYGCEITKLLEITKPIVTFGYKNSGLDITKITLSGSFDKRYSELASLLESKGFKVTKTVSKQTNLLVQSTKGSNQISQALKLGKKILEVSDTSNLLDEIYKALDISKEDADLIKEASLSEGKKSIVLTGALDIPRSELTRILETAGYEVKGTVSKETSLLIEGVSKEDALNSNKISSKMQKAMKLGIKILQLEDSSDILEKIKNALN